MSDDPQADDLVAMVAELAIIARQNWQDEMGEFGGDAATWTPEDEDGAA